MGLYVLMFVSVLKTVMKVSVVVFMFIIAYAVAFNMLLRNQARDLGYEFLSKYHHNNIIL